MTKLLTELSESDLQSLYNDSQHSIRLSSLIKRRELIKHSRMETFEYGDIVEIIGAPEDVEFLEYFIGSTGMVVGKAGSKKNPDGSQNYVIEFGELKLIYCSKDLMKIEEWG